MRTRQTISALQSALQRNLGLISTLEHVTEGHLIVDELAKENLPLAVGPTLGHATKFELQNKTWENLPESLPTPDVMSPSSPTHR